MPVDDEKEDRRIHNEQRDDREMPISGEMEIGYEDRRELRRPYHKQKGNRGDQPALPG